MARPLRFEEPLTEVVRVRVTSTQRLALEQVAQDNHTDLAGAIREAVNGYVADYRDGVRVFCGPKPSTRA